MARKSEEKTKGLVANKLKSIEDYPSQQDTILNGIGWFKEDSYKVGKYNWLGDVFEKATKKQTGDSRGTPDYVVIKENADIIIVIECKADKNKHSTYAKPEMYKVSGYGNMEETQNYAVNGALWYASFLADQYDVVAIGVSGQEEFDSSVTSFVWPKGGKIADIEVLEDGSLANSIVSINQYEKDISRVLHRFASTEEEIRKELRRYTLVCANFLRSNGIEDNSKAGFVSAVILGLTNHESKLYNDTKAAIDLKNASKSKKLIDDPIGKNAIKMLKGALYGEGNEYEDDYINGIWDIDKIPKGKRTSLKKFYDGLLSKNELTQAPKGKDSKYFCYGDTVLSCCIYSLYEHVVEVFEKYSGIDIMGEFYTTFLRFTKGNAKEKGIVLTPKHITELFCDIAQYYLGNEFDENIKVLDICCGTGAFLISALAKIRKNIQSKKISETEKTRLYSIAQGNSLIGVERDPSMYALAYANMRFHGDGKSNLFNCSSLLIDSYAPADDSGKTYLNDDKKMPLYKALESFGDIDVALINPPYSLDKKDASSDREYSIIRKRNESQEILKNLERRLRDSKRTSASESEIKAVESEIQKAKKNLEEIEKELKSNNLEEVVISKGQSELDFIASMLHYLKVGGIGVAIVPMSCAGNSGKKFRAEILKHHTLLACMTMPNQLFFDSHVGTATCTMVFKAHVKHDENKAVFFARWQDDGFKVIPHNGRKDSGAWEQIKQEWLNQIDGTADIKAYSWLKHRINNEGEALPEAYLTTNYDLINKDCFKNVVRKYALYKFMDANMALEIKDSNKINWLLDNYLEFESSYSKPAANFAVDLTDRQWDVFKFSNIVNEVHNGTAYNKEDLTGVDTSDYVIYVTRSDQNNGVSMCVQAMDYEGLEKAGAITIGDTTATAFYQDHDFITGPHIIVVRADWLNVYTALFIIALLNQEKYRYPVFGRAFTKDLIKDTLLRLPVDKDGNPDYKFMEEYIKSLPYSQNI